MVYIATLSKERITLAVTSFLLIIALFFAAAAQANTYSDKKQQFDALYQQMLSNPADTDLTLKYAELAVDIGDYEAAIPPLERLLIGNPKSAKLQLELGILYYLLGSYDTAKTYLQEAKTGESAQPAIKQQADDYLRRM